jgi:hypothetical protein
MFTIHGTHPVISRVAPGNSGPGVKPGNFEQSRKDVFREALLFISFI